MYNQRALFWGGCFCIMVRLLYHVVHAFLSALSPKYSNMAVHRQMYVQKNMVKSVVLALMLPPALVFIAYPIWQHGVWHTMHIHYFAVLYGANDFVGLVCVDKLPKTTRVHHIVCTFLVLTSLALDFNVSPVAQSMLVYTFFAASSYIVNFHLAIRWLFPRGELQRLRLIAAVVYAVCCVVSWCWQVWWVWHTPLEWYHCLYIGLMFWIVRDDIILMQWLVSI